MLVQNLYILLAAFAVGSSAMPQPLLHRLMRRDWATVTRDAQIVDADIRTINTDTNALSNPATGTQVLVLSRDLSQCSRDLQQGTRDALATIASSVTVANAQNLINYYNTTLEPDVRTAMNNLVSKRPRFTTSRVFVSIPLGYIQGNFTAFNSAVVAKIPASPTTLRPAFTSIASRISSAIARASSVYANP